MNDQTANKVAFLLMARFSLDERNCQIVPLADGEFRVELKGDAPFLAYRFLKGWLECDPNAPAERGKIRRGKQAAAEAYTEGWKACQDYFKNR